MLRINNRILKECLINGLYLVTILCIWFEFFKAVASLIINVCQLLISIFIKHFYINSNLLWLRFLHVANTTLLSDRYRWLPRSILLLFINILIQEMFGLSPFFEFFFLHDGRLIDIDLRIKFFEIDKIQLICMRSDGWIIFIYALCQMFRF